MFVYLMVNILPGLHEAGASMQRPPNWSSHEMHVKSCGSPVRCGGIGRGEAEETELWKVPVELAERYVAYDPERYATLTEEQATGIIALCKFARGDDPDTEMISDPERLHAIDVKLRAKAAGYDVSLTANDLKALDPEDAVRGISRPLTAARDLYGGREAASDTEATRIEADRVVEVERKRVASV